MELPNPGYRPRRPHTKSRTGCAYCKRRRIKCDEIKPSCTRCVQRNIPCEYEFRVKASYSPTGPRTSTSEDGDEDDDARMASSTSSSQNLLGVAGPFPGLGVNQFPTTSNQGLSSPLAMSFDDSQDMELLNHYHTHTSQNMTFLADELSVLQVDIPNLASSCSALMHSLLALSAACLACDLLPSLADGSGTTATTPEQIQHLLAAGDRHHTASMRDIQNYMARSSDEPHSLKAVLANATLMAIYGSANHRAQTWLAQQIASTPEGDTANIVVFRFRWLFLFRAAHLAYRAFVGRCEETGRRCEKELHENASPSPRGDNRMGDTPHPLLFAIRATAPVAMIELSGNVLAAQESSANNEQPEVVSGLNACATAFEVLRDIATTVVSGTNQSGGGPASSTSLLRGIIMSFLNRVPQEYYNLIQIDQENRDDSNSNSKTSELAMNILAHWLVFVMLLDGVWWIGDVGSWELQHVLEDVGQDLGTYWPARMYHIVSDMKQNARRGNQ